MAYHEEYTAPDAAAVLTTDRQTGLPTLIRLCTDLTYFLKHTSHLSLIICGVDGLPAENDSDGLALKLVQAVANTAIEIISASPGASAYRIAADSFAIMLPGVRRPAALRLAEQFRRQIDRRALGITATMAVASAPHDAGEAGALIALCETQLLCPTDARNRVYAAAPVETLPPATARLANLLIARIITLVELGQQLQETEQQALQDTVSGLPNSRSLEQTLPRFLERCASQDAPLALLLVDGDNLKQYNAENGYHIGNEWIRTIARTLSNNLRPGDYVARWMMGDEFIVLLPDTPSDQALEVAERLRRAVEREGETGEFPGTISVGAVLVNDASVEPGVVLENARHALQEAKGKGKNQIAAVEVAKLRTEGKRLKAEC